MAFSRTSPDPSVPFGPVTLAQKPARSLPSFPQDAGVRQAFIHCRGNACRDHPPVGLLTWPEIPNRLASSAVTASGCEPRAASSTKQ